jgi:hypothetical protein
MEGSTRDMPIKKKVNLHLVTVQQQRHSFLKLYVKRLQMLGTLTEQLYNCDETALYYKLLSKECLDLQKAPSKVGMKIKKESVT